MTQGRPRSTPPARGARGRPPRRRTRGVLLFLASLMLVSGAIRLGSGLSQALARDAASAPALPARAAPDPAPLLARLAEREARLDAREAALADRIQALAVVEARVEEQLAALAEAEAGLAATLALADAAAERDIARLTAVYENMKPKEAAQLFEEMETRFAAGFVARMAPEAAAALLAGLEPRTAYAISVILAGRHSGVPTE